MTYPTPPGPRIMYDQMGSVAFFSNNVDGTGVKQASQQWLEALNGDSSNEAAILNQWGSWPSSQTSVAPQGWTSIRFPLAMRLRAITASLWFGNNQWMRNVSFVVETSTDSTNGQDGTWLTLRNYVDEDDFQHTPNTNPNGTPSVDADIAPMVNAVVDPGASVVEITEMPRRVFSGRRNSFDLAGEGWRLVSGGASRHVRWIRLRSTEWGTQYFANNGQGVMYANMKLHLYGEPDDSADSNRLAFVTSAGANKPFFDFGDLHAGQVLTQDFKIKNLSSTLTASGASIEILPQNPSRTIPSPELWCEMSIDGGVSWYSDIPLGDILPGGESALISLRVSPEPGTFGPWSPRLRASVEEWV